MDLLFIGAALVGVAVWLVLLLGRDGFGRMRARLDDWIPPLLAWPDVVAMMPTCNEAEVIRRSFGPLLPNRGRNGPWIGTVLSRAHQGQA